MKFMMVLSDGETYSELDGCAIVAIPDDTPDHLVDEVVKEADGYYIFTDTPYELEGNNGVTMDDLKNLGMDERPDYVKCIGCGRMFNLKVWHEDLAYTSHNCESNVDW